MKNPVILQYSVVRSRKQALNHDICFIRANPTVIWIVYCLKNPYTKPRETVENNGLNDNNAW